MVARWKTEQASLVMMIGDRVGTGRGSPWDGGSMRTWLGDLDTRTEDDSHCIQADRRWLCLIKPF